MFLHLFLLSLINLGLVRSTPLYLPRSSPLSTEATIPFSLSDIDSQLVRPAEFARVVYCSSTSVTGFTCGAPCDAIQGVEILQSGGDQGDIPRYLIAHDPSTQSIVLAHQGTHPENILSDLNDLELALTGFNTTLFPNAVQGIEVHDGFQRTFERTADTVLVGIQAALQTKGVKNVMVTGHSLGAAVATMGAVMLRQQLDPSIQITTVVLGLPRGGNQQWADFVDSTLGSTFIHVTNQNDPVPNIPPRSLNFQQPSGEVHIKAVNSAGNATNIVSCPGQENENCSEGNSVFATSVSNHLGPYFDDISMGDAACSA